MIPAKVASSSCTTYYDVGILPYHRELLFRFQPDDGLVHEHVIEHASEGILGILGGDRVLYCLANCDAEASRMLGFSARNFLPAFVSGLGLGTHLPPHVSIMIRR